MNCRVDRATVPAGLYCYDLRGGKNDDPGDPCTVEENVFVNHAGTVLTTAKVKFPDGQAYRNLDDSEDGGINFGGGFSTIAEFFKNEIKC